MTFLITFTQWNCQCIFLVCMEKVWKSSFVCLSECMGLRELCCSPPRGYRTTFCTTNLHCAPSSCIVHHGAQGAPMSVSSEGRPRQTFTLVVHNVALFWLGGAQDDFAWMLSATTEMVHKWCCQCSCTCSFQSMLNKCLIKRCQAKGKMVKVVNMFQELPRAVNVPWTCEHFLWQQSH